MKRFLKIICCLLSLVFLMAGLTPIAQAIDQPGDNFSPLMRQFIKDGKKVRILLQKYDKRISLTPCQNITGTNLQNKDQTFKLKKDKRYEIRFIHPDNIFWRLQIFATYDRTKATEVKSKLEKSGYDKINIVRDDKWYKVQVGNFEERSQVKPLADKLTKEGWTNWPVSHRVDKSTIKIGIFNTKQELVFSGYDFSLSGRLKLDNNLYQGKFEFLYSPQGLNTFHTLKFTDLLSGIISTKNEKITEIRESTYFAALKAQTVAYRTNILYKYFNKAEDYLIFPAFKGLKEKNNRVRRAVNRTRGEIIFYDDKIINTLSPQNDDNYTVNNKFSFIGAIAMAARGEGYKKILKQYYNATEIRDLSEKIDQELKVDASVQWGLKYKEFRQITWSGQRVISVLDLDLDRNNFKVDTFLARNKIPGLTNLEDVVKKQGALVGINGGFYSYTGRPLGLLIKSNQIISESIKNRTALALTADNEVFIDRVSWTGSLESLKDKSAENNKLKIAGANRPPRTDEIVIFNGFYGEQVPGLKPGIREMVIVNNQIISINDINKVTNPEGTLIPENGYILHAHGDARNKFDRFNEGEKVNLDHEFNNQRWNKEMIVTAIGGGPTILEEGEVNITGSKEEFQPDILQGRAPRSAAGLTADNHLVFVTVDGRQPGLSIGITLTDLALFMKDYGVVEAMNLDGGGSARMVVRGYTMSNPSENRLISNGVLIFGQ